MDDPVIVDDPIILILLLPDVSCLNKKSEIFYNNRSATVEYSLAFPEATITIDVTDLPRKCI